MRHCSLFVGYSAEERKKLCAALSAELKSAFGVQVIHCGVDPFPNPWGFLSDELQQWSDHALILQC
jgi:hypothetical protein